MPLFDADSVVTQSFLDRLTDREPAVSSEAPMSRSKSVQGLKASLRHDLEWLLNTRRTPDEVAEEYPELARSLHNYGFPDFTTFSFSNPRDRQRLVRELEAVIRIFEPRLSSVRVVAQDQTAENKKHERSVRFQIEGMLRMDPAPEQITFDTVLSLTSGEYQIRGETE